ncbi:MAG: polysaccharide deacetylase family protein, partial [Acidimicrobiia bacterium]|nr:polysaccharide deacetylase family protein [Acidimicrobiia bacterium]
FFPPVMTTQRHDVLDVNKIHFILASVRDPGEVVRELEALFHDHDLDRHTGRSFADHVEAIDTQSRFDPPDVIVIKRLLQRDLPADARSLFCQELFRRHVTDDIGAFADELYMSVSQLETMTTAGHEVGSHGHNHVWLGASSPDDQRYEIRQSVEFLRNSNLLRDDWTMCYPYGSYDRNTLDILAEAGCSIGVTTVPASVDPQDYRPLELPRLDTNDFPKA